MDKKVDKGSHIRVPTSATTVLFQVSSIQYPLIVGWLFGRSDNIVVVAGKQCMKLAGNQRE